MLTKMLLTETIKENYESETIPIQRKLSYLVIRGVVQLLFFVSLIKHKKYFRSKRLLEENKMFFKTITIKAGVSLFIW